MLSLPELRLGDRIIRLPLSPRGTVDVANAWTTADAGERHSRWQKLLEREPGLTQWAEMRWQSAARCLSDNASTPGNRLPPVAGTPNYSPTMADLIRCCDEQLLTAFREARCSPLEATDATAEQDNESDEQRSDIASIDLTALARCLTPTGSVTAATACSPTTGDEVIRPSSTVAELENQKLAALREFAYGLSHEINNPLANIATRAQTLLRAEDDVERRRSLSVISQQAMRAHTMIADLMLFAKPPALRKSEIHPRRLVEQLVDELREWASSQGTQLELVWLQPSSTTHSTPPMLDTLHADAQQLLVALRALVTNALEALSSGGRVELDVERRDVPEGDSISAAGCRSGGITRFVIRDNGPGIPATVRAHLFDPYYSGREAGRGLGVGLCKAWRIVTDHGGTIEVLDAPGGGAEFHVDIPASQTDETLSS